MKNLLLIVLLIWFVGSWCYLGGLSSKPQYRPQPFIILNTEEIIRTGDTLYVSYATPDSLYLWGK